MIKRKGGPPNRARQTATTKKSNIRNTFETQKTDPAAEGRSADDV